MTSPGASSILSVRALTVRPILSRERSIGSVIKLLTPSRSEYTADYNAWLSRIPPYVKELVYAVKRSHRPEWGDDWRSHFSVAEIDGRQGNSLFLDGVKVTLNMLRVGYDVDGSWRLFSLRHDFSPAVKVQTQDDITASTVVPGALAAGSTPTGPTSSSRTARACCSSVPTTRSTVATTPSPSVTSPPRAPSCPTSSR